MAFGGDFGFPFTNGIVRCNLSWNFIQNLRYTCANCGICVKFGILIQRVTMSSKPGLVEPAGRKRGGHKTTCSFSRKKEPEKDECLSWAA